MKNRKGFTLVELLAVVAILAVIVIIALPNVLGMFNSAKKNSFETEVKNIYKTAQQQWISESLFNSEEKVYSRCDGCTGKELDLNGRKELKYYIKLNKSGQVVEYYATDGTYQFSHNGDLLLTNIEGIETVADLENSEVLKIENDIAYKGDEPPKIVNGEIFIAYEGQAKIGEAIPENLVYYNSLSELETVSNRPVFLKHVVRNNVITESYLGFKYNDNIYYVQGGSSSVSQDSRINQLRTIYNNNGCRDETQNGEVYGFRCINTTSSYSGKMDVGVYNDSRVVGWRVYGCYVGCRINADGSSSCDPEEIVC